MRLLVAVSSLIALGGCRTGPETLAACDVEVVFGSYCCGPAADVRRQVQARVQSDQSLQVRSVIASGIEGESTLCLKARSQADAERAFEDIKSLIPEYSERAWTSVTLASGQSFKTKWPLPAKRPTQID